MNNQKTIKLNRIKRECEHNLTHLKDLIRWCEDYKAGKGDIGLIMGTFTLKYDDVAFIIENLGEIKEVMKNGY